MVAAPVGLPAFAATQPDFQHPRMPNALNLLNRAQWNELVSQLAAEPPQSAFVLLRDLGSMGPPSENTQILEGLASTKGGATIAGAIMLGWAWLSRGVEYRIKDPDEFGRRLDMTASYLDAALVEAPDDGMALTHYIGVAKSSDDRELLGELMRRLQMAPRKPLGWLTAYANALSERWGGSDEALIEFSKSHANAMPPGSYGLIPDAYTDIALQKWSRDIFSSNIAHFGMEKFLRKGNIVAEIEEAHERFVSAPADPDLYAMRLAHAQFSLAFRSLGMTERTKYHIAGQGLLIDGAWRTYPGAKSEIRYLTRRFAHD